jgi:hypothetical protein
MNTTDSGGLVVEQLHLSFDMAVTAAAGFRTVHNQQCN